MSRHLPQRCIFMMPFCFAVSIALVEALIVPAFMAKVWTSSGFQIPNCMSFHVSRPSIHSKLIKKIASESRLVRRSEAAYAMSGCPTLGHSARQDLAPATEPQRNSAKMMWQMSWCYMFISFNFIQLNSIVVLCTHYLFVFICKSKYMYHMSTLHKSPHNIHNIVFFPFFSEPMDSQLFHVLTDLAHKS